MVSRVRMESGIRSCYEWNLEFVVGMKVLGVELEECRKDSKILNSKMSFRLFVVRRW